MTRFNAPPELDEVKEALCTLQRMVTGHYLDVQERADAHKTIEALQDFVDSAEDEAREDMNRER